MRRSAGASHRTARPRRLGQGGISCDEVGAQPFRESHVPAVVHREVVAKLPDPLGERLELVLDRPQCPDLGGCRAYEAEFAPEHHGAKSGAHLGAEDGRHLEDRPIAELAPGHLLELTNDDESVNNDRGVDGGHGARSQCDSRSARMKLAEEILANPPRPSTRIRRATSSASSAKREIATSTAKYTTRR